MYLDDLRRTVRGAITTAHESGFADAIHGTLWNRLIPDRAPQLVVRAADEDDVIAAVKFARANGLKVVVRGGGHNWCQPSLRNGGLMLDLQDFTKVRAIDAANRRAVIQPIISNRDLQKSHNPLGLAYPTGHCPQVKVSGYLLGGGMAWNPTIWGYGAESVAAIELVTAAGELITASETENPDYFWAARGAGSGFFGIVTTYHLDLHPLPKAIHGAESFYRLDDASRVGAWLGETAPLIAPSVELTLLLVKAPPALREAAAARNGWVCLVTATAFEETPEAARRALRPLEQYPVTPLSRATAAPLDFEQLFDASGAVFPEAVRSRVEAAYSNHSPRDLIQAVLDLWPKAPSDTSVFPLAIFCGPNVSSPRRDMARSMTSKVYGGPWTMWRDASADQVNADRHRALTEALQPFTIGYYIGESNTVDRPEIVPQAFTPETWRKLSALRDRHDPDRVFFDYLEGLAEGSRS